MRNRAERRVARAKQVDFRSAYRPSTRPVGAVVIGGDFQGLGVVQSLGRRGIPICIIDDERSIATVSRFKTHAVRVPDLRDEERAVEAVLDVGRRLGLEGWVLYPTRDETVAAISRHRSLLSEWYRVPTAPWNTIEWAWDKRRTYRLAAELDIPTPRTWYPSSEDDLDGLSRYLPLAVKPAIKEHFIYATKAKAWRANTRAELTARYRQAVELLPAGEVMLQEIIPGDGHRQFGYCAFFRDGQAVGSMVACRRRQHPAEFGRASTFVETVDIPALEALSQRFLQAIDYYGLVELEYKFDARAGEYKLLDFNARTWGYHSLGASAGVDFSYLLYADQLGELAVPCRARPGVGWMRLTTDVPTALLEIRAARLDWRAYLASVRRVDVEPVFSWKDPMPGLMELALIPYLAVKRGF